jgi:tripartite-type tricarboxylate transporter receptor subunit TctC
MQRTIETAACAMIALSLGGSPASAQSVADFYKGKQIELVIGTTPGNTYDQWARLIAVYLPKHLPGNPTIVPKNMPGAGHIIATNYLFNKAPKDGTSLAMFSRNMPTQAVLKHPSVQFKPAEFNWIGSPELSNRLCVSSEQSKVKTGEDLFKQELFVGGAGSGSAVSTTPVLLKGILGMKFNLVDGYHGANDVFLGMERGEVEGICQTLAGIEATKPGGIKQGKLHALFNLEKKPIDGIDAPSIFKFTTTEEQRQVIVFYNSNAELGRPFVAPPGVPADRVAALRTAFDDTMKDSDFRREAERQGLELHPLTGAELAGLVADIAKTPEGIVAKTESLVGKLSE